VKCEFFDESFPLNLMTGPVGGGVEAGLVRLGPGLVMFPAIRDIPVIAVCCGEVVRFRMGGVRCLSAWAGR
jgi:hypothetical protein